MKKIFFGKNLKYLRKKLNLNQDEIYNHIGFKRATWSGYETESSFPNFKDLLKISEYFGIDEGDLINTDLENVHLNEKKEDEKKQENVHLNVHPSVHPIKKNKTKYDYLTSIENELTEVLNDQDMQYQSEHFNQEQMAELSRRMGKIEAFISKLSKEIEDQRKRKGKRGP